MSQLLHVNGRRLWDSQMKMAGIGATEKGSCNHQTLTAEFAPWSQVTFGDIKALAGSRNTVPEQLVPTVDLRHPEQSTLGEMDRRFRDIARQECDKLSLAGEIHDEGQSPAVKFDQHCIDAGRHSAQALGYSYKEIFSGAGHDSVYVSRVAPTSMIFVPCEKGISHNEAENAKPEDIEAGCNLLINAMLALAGLPLSRRKLCTTCLH